MSQVTYKFVRAALGTTQVVPRYFSPTKYVAKEVNFTVDKLSPKQHTLPKAEVLFIDTH